MGSWRSPRRGAPVSAAERCSRATVSELQVAVHVWLCCTHNECMFDCDPALILWDVVFFFLLLLLSSLCLSAAAVCDFCKKRESELYQKEVCVKELGFLTVPYLLCVCVLTCVS